MNENVGSVVGGDPQVNKYLGDFEDNPLMLVEVSSDKYLEITGGIIETLVNKRGMEGIYVTLNRPYFYLVEKFKQMNINLEQLRFIDGITSLSLSKVCDDTPDCIYIDGPSDNSGLSIAITTMLEKLIGKQKFLIIDSLSTMLVYTDKTTLAKFVHFQTTKLRYSKVAGLFVSIGEEIDPGLRETVTQFCDVTLKVT